MTPAQEKLAEELIARMKEDGEGSIGWVKFQKMRSYQYNDVFLAVQGLKDIGIVEEYPGKPESIRFISPNGYKFTTFKKYRKKIFWQDFPKNYWYLMLIVGVVIGWFSDIGKELLLLKEKSNSQELRPTTPTSVDTGQNHRIDSVK